MKKMHFFLILLLPILCFGQSDTPFIEYQVKERSVDYFNLVLFGDGGWHKGDQEFAGIFMSTGFPPWVGMHECILVRKNQGTVLERFAEDDFRILFEMEEIEGGFDQIFVWCRCHTFSIQPIRWGSQKGH
jgi:hypothetical protein